MRYYLKIGLTTQKCLIACFDVSCCKMLLAVAAAGMVTNHEAEKRGNLLAVHTYVGARQACI